MNKEKLNIPTNKEKDLVFTESMGTIFAELEKELQKNDTYAYKNDRLTHEKNFHFIF